MKLFTLLAITGGLFFNSLCLNNGDVKTHSNVKHCIKKCCKNVKCTKGPGFNMSKTVSQWIAA